MQNLKRLMMNIQSGPQISSNTMRELLNLLIIRKTAVMVDQDIKAILSSNHACICVALLSELAYVCGVAV